MKVKEVMKAAKANGFSVKGNSIKVSLGNNVIKVDVRERNFMNKIADLAEKYAYSAVGEALGNFYFSVMEG